MTGKVVLIGAGPGDPELMTLKARARLQGADLVIHDPDLDPRILDFARREAERIPLHEAAAAVKAQAAARGGALVAWLVVGSAEDALIGDLPGSGVDFETIPGVAAQVAADIWTISLPLAGGARES